MVLPIPASPLKSTSAPLPESPRRTASSMRSSSRRRPMMGVTVDRIKEGRPSMEPDRTASARVQLPPIKQCGGELRKHDRRNRVLARCRLDDDDVRADVPGERLELLGVEIE